MDGCSFEPSGAVPHLKKAQTEDTPRPPLGPSEKNNAAHAARKPRTREIASRYKSKSGISSTPNSTPIAPRRCPSPNASRSSPTPGASLSKRAQSAERKRPSTPSSRSSVPSTPSSRPSTPSSRSSVPSTPSSRPSTPSSPSSRSTTTVFDAVTEMHSSSRPLRIGQTPDGLWPSMRPSMRSLSSSFQSESISIPVIKRERVVISSSPDHTSKSSANVVAVRKRTPLRGRNTSDQSENFRPVESLNTRVVDQKLWPGVMDRKVASNTLSRSTDLADKVTRSASLPISSRGVSPRRVPVSDGAPRGLQQSTIEVASGRVERDTGFGLNASTHPSERALSVTRPSRTQSSPIPGLHRPPSPSRTLSTPSSTSRGMSSPSRTRPSTSFSSSISTASRAGATPSVLNYIVDARKGKKSTNHIDDAHQLRLLYNRDLQWRFVNARAEEALFIQKIRTENTLYNVWNTTSELRDSVILKRINVQHLRQEMKLDIILKEQMSYLEEWAALDVEHCSSLSGATEALKASTLRLPVTRGARADVYAVKNAVSSAVDVMQAMGSSICYLLSKVEGTKTLVSELSAVAAKERAMLDECRELLASTAALQVQESSLRTHLIELRQGVHKMV